MNLYSRARKHIDMKRVKELHEEKIKAQMASKLIERQLEIAAELKEIEREKSKFSNWRKDINESDWAPIAGGGPTNSASQTFEYGGEGGPQFTANGLGGQDVYPQTIDFLGDQIPTPSYSDVALQGYAQPLSKEVMKRDKDAEEFRKKQDENLQNIKDTLESLGTSWEEMRANNWAIVKPDGTSIMLEPITPGNKQLNWIDNSVEEYEDGLLS